MKTTPGVLPVASSFPSVLDIITHLIVSRELASPGGQLSNTAYKVSKRSYFKLFNDWLVKRSFGLHLVTGQIGSIKMPVKVYFYAFYQRLLPLSSGLFLWHYIEERIFASLVTYTEPGLATTRQVKFDLNERPFIVIWEMTRACDLKCKHCRAMASPERDHMELSTKEAKSLLDDIASLGSPKPVVVLTGGDPCKREDLLELISYSRSLGLATGVAPSGTPLLSQEMVTNIRQAGATSMSLSLDGAGPETHDSFRGEPGSFELTLDAAITAISAGMRLQLNSSVCKTTVTELPKLAKLALELGVITWSLFLLVPTGRGLDLEALSAD
ncbi:MAG: radical SAM protein, partial [Acidimicrobiales bacterium]|nr:radical SAM protein [Acidimicrobiales bacterium]